MDLRSYKHALHAGWAEILVLIVAGVLGSTLGLVLAGPRFTSTVQIYVASPGTGSIADLAQGNTFSEGRIATYSTVIESPAVLTPVIEDLGLRDSPDELASRISVTSDRSTVVMSVSVQDAVQVDAGNLAAAVARQAKETIEALEASSPTVGNASPVRLTILSPHDASSGTTSPDTLLHLVTGLVLGLTAGLAVAVFRYSATTKLTSEDAIKEIASLDILGRIPVIRKTWRSRAEWPAESNVATESFQQLCTNLSYTMSIRGRRSILVSSPNRREGKTTVSVNLAKAFANRGSSVVVVDANFPDPGIADVLELDTQLGLSNVLAGTAHVSGTLQSRDDLGISALTTGPLPPNSVELLTSPQMRATVLELQSRFDVVIFDGPAVLQAAETRMLSAVIDALLLVVAEGITERSDFLAALSILEVSGGSLAGVVNNGISDLYLSQRVDPGVSERGSDRVRGKTDFS